MSVRRLALGGVVLALVAGFTSAVVPTASADTAICTQYGTATVGGRYIVQNNRWGASTTQCISVTGSGFTVTQADHHVATNGAPASYPSIYYGCHYGNCSPGTTLPAAASAVSGLRTSVSMTYPGSGTYDASYDIWYDPTARRTGQNTGIEIMVWLNRQGSIQPIGSKVATVTLEGHSWDVWAGDGGGWKVASYVSSSPITSMSFAPASFFNDAVGRGYAQRSWYLTSIQAGFEPWIGGAGLAVNSFSVS